jgi:biotin carboxyl carrier protein
VRFKIKIDKTEHQIEAAADGTVVIDGKTFNTQVSASAGDRRTVQVGDATFEILVFKQGDAETGESSKYVLEVGGERVPLTVSDIAKGSAIGTTDIAGGATAEAPSGKPGGESGKAGEAPTEVKDGIWAPVPGKIMDVRVKAGDSVKEGDLVVILEAMKMENELHASKQAKVAAVPVKKGEQVQKGQLLVAFE